MVDPADKQVKPSAPAVSPGDRHAGPTDTGAARLEALRVEHQVGMRDDSSYDLNVGWEFSNLKKQRDKDIADDKYDSEKKEEYEKEVAELKKILDEMPEDRRKAVEDYIRKNSETKH